MKILFYNRDESWWTGGDMVQLHSTMTTLERLGIECTYSHNINEDISQYDLVHIFHLTFQWSIDMIARCIRENKPYIISAIFYPELGDNPDLGMLVNKSKITIALSNAERLEIIRFTRCNPSKVTVISNGIDSTIFNIVTKPIPESLAMDYTPEVVSIGQIHSPKGIHYLATACKELGVNYTHIGKTYSDGEPYLNSVKDNITKIFYELNSIEVATVLQRHKVYVCASESERQSLGVLEGASCGLHVVDSKYNRGNTLLKNSIIVDPKNNTSLKQAIETSLSKPGLNIDVIPSWDDVAKEILTWYQS